MSSINDIISSTAATNPTVGSALTAGTMQAELLSTLNGATSSSNDLFSLIAAANSEAALAPAALYTPSAELTAAMNAGSGSTSPFSTPAVTAAADTAGMESQLLNGLGGSFNGIA